jgi:hypothetical protein
VTTATRTLEVIARWVQYGGEQQQLRLHTSEALVEGPSGAEKLFPAADLAVNAVVAVLDGREPYRLTPFGAQAVELLDQARGLEALSLSRYQLRLLPGLAWTQTEQQRDDYAEVAIRAVRTAWNTTQERPG